MLNTRRPILKHCCYGVRLCLLAMCFASLLSVTTLAGVKSKPKNDECLACHGDASLTTERNGKSVSLYVNPDLFKASIHGGMFACVECHTDVHSSPHENTPAKITCATCHADQQAAYDRSYHAKAIKAGDDKAATCTNCHG